MAKKRILFVDHDTKITGSTVSMRYIIDGFYKNNFDILLLTSKDEQSLQYFRDYNIEFIRWEYRVELSLYFTNFTKTFSISGIKSLIRLSINFIKGCIFSFNYLKKIKPDLVYINEYVLSQFAITAKTLRLPVVTHVRSPFIKGAFGIRRFLLSNLLNIFNDYVFAISKQEAEQILENISDKKSNIKVIYEFLNGRDFFADYDIDKLKELFSIPANKKVILMAGGIEPIKGSLELIDAFSKLTVKHKDIYLIITGPINNNPVYNEKCFSIINNNKLNNVVQIIEFTEEIQKLIACSDMLISSSSYSHFSRPVIEAWAQKKAVIASDTRHSKEIIIDNIDGLLFETGNSDSLAEKISILLSDKNKLNYLGTAGYIKVKQKFSAEINVNQIINYCLSVL